jgi:glycosyltransferase involved in cell wall biosynthesis
LPKNRFMPIKVLSIIDSLIAAGAERMAVNIANGLGEAGVDSFLCATHSSGDLAQFFYNGDKLFVAGKKSAFDLMAFLRLLKFVRINRIEVLHAHSSSIFWACMLKVCKPSLKVVWHDHFGMSDYLHLRSKRGLMLLKPLVGFVYVVNTNLYKYAVEVLKVHPDKVHYLCNFPNLDFSGVRRGITSLPNSDMGPKVLHLANIRPQKDHHNLLAAFGNIKATFPNAQLYLVGGDNNDAYLDGVRKAINQSAILKNSVHLLGSRNDIPEIMVNCDMGVLSSLSEGLPVSLLEYGLASLPVVCTNVGECADVLGNGKYGVVVEPRNADALSEAIVSALKQTNESTLMAKQFNEHVHLSYSKESAVAHIINTYKQLLKY